ncbi:MAG: preprotein translocase subunit SecG [Candidatus Doudnabacteria bacterium]|nr:preprotein translocase subunit SecG [Candidatus Doudnabacteria bacterium]
MLPKIINFAQIIISVTIIALIILQNKGTAMGTVFGGEGNVFHSRRGAEKWLFVGTAIAIGLFIVLGVANLILQNRSG